MKVKNNKFQKGDVVFWTLPDKFCYILDDYVPVKIKTVFAVEESYRYLVKFLNKGNAEQAGGFFYYVDEVALVDPDVVNRDV